MSVWEIKAPRDCRKTVDEPRRTRLGAARRVQASKGALNASELQLFRKSCAAMTRDSPWNGQRSEAFQHFISHPPAPRFSFE